jgi:hypothetical protein
MILLRRFVCVYTETGGCTTYKEYTLLASHIDASSPCRIKPAYIKGANRGGYASSHCDMWIVAIVDEVGVPKDLQALRYREGPRYHSCRGPGCAQAHPQKHRLRIFLGSVAPH